MMRDPSYDILFEPVRIGPVTAPNRFYQVPHCTGMGYVLPQTLAAMREVKAEGGRGVLNTEYCSIHPTSDDLPFPFCSLWDEQDVRNLRLMTDKVHGHGALAGVELWHGGLRSSNLHSRATPLAPESLPLSNDPWQAQRMDRADLRDFRRWHLDAVGRARDAGFDIIYVYAAHTYLLAQFLDPALNRRTDEYGGSMHNRSRLIRELLEDARNLVGGTCALAVRIEVDNEDGSSGGRDELLSGLAPLCDLFDVTVADYEHEMGVSRFVKEASLEDKVAHVRQLTGKPVVGVGRFTSPDTMVSQVRRGILDLVGAARPSIADPFLPAKIRDGRLDEVRECIGCNICYAGDGQGVPIRCTQNPTMGEEWRRGWHPERVARADRQDTVLVVGAGPAGLEASLVLARQGHTVLLADAEEELGGRVNREARLPGLSEWIRVRDYRLQQLSQMANVSLFPASPMTAADILASDAPNVVIATGSRWRIDGRGRSSTLPIAGLGPDLAMSPDDIMGGSRLPQGTPVVVYDDDGYYMASALAELLATEGFDVSYVASAVRVADWSTRTTEQAKVHARLHELGIRISLNQSLNRLQDGEARFEHTYTGEILNLPCGTLVPVTSREPQDQLWQELSAQPSGLKKLVRIGDCRAPGLIATAVYDGHRAARELLAPEQAVAARRERAIAPG
jgi:dimethylamine/trimethylamine dehydrogenase